MHYLPLAELEAGMVLAMPVYVVLGGQLRFSLPATHTLTMDNLRQLAAHQAECVYVDLPDERSDQDLANPAMAALFDQVLIYRSR
jgi:hypothetical protein